MPASNSYVCYSDFDPLVEVPKGHKKCTSNECCQRAVKYANGMGFARDYVEVQYDKQASKCRIGAARFPFTCFEKPAPGQV